MPGAQEGTGNPDEVLMHLGAIVWNNLRLLGFEFLQFFCAYEARERESLQKFATTVDAEKHYIYPNNCLGAISRIITYYFADLSLIRINF